MRYRLVSPLLTIILPVGVALVLHYRLGFSPTLAALAAAGALLLLSCIFVLPGYIVHLDAHPSGGKLNQADYVQATTPSEPR